MSTRPQEPKWQKTRVANLIRYVPSGVYFARAKVGGKLIRVSLKTKVFSVAQLLLADRLKEQRSKAERINTIQQGKVTFADALRDFEANLQQDPSLSEGAKLYRRKTIAALLKSWPGVSQLPVAQITEADCKAWAARFSKKYSASVFNNTVGTLRMIIDVAIKVGARYSNPAMAIGKVPIKQRQLSLPSPQQFEALAQAIESAGGRFSKPCAHLFRFLAYGGFRKTEAAHITWADCDFINSSIAVRKTKNGHERVVPMIPAMRTLLQKIQKDRSAEPETSMVMVVHECQKAIDAAAKKLGLRRITHHDLRHLFATTCIESGVDIPTVSRWLGHRDGGALAMKVYGHLRDHHSVAMAQKVSFAVPNTKPNPPA